MSWSHRNPAWHRLQQQRADADRQDVVARALALRKAEPGWSWGEAVRRAELGPWTIPAKPATL